MNTFNTPFLIAIHICHDKPKCNLSHYHTDLDCMIKNATHIISSQYSKFHINPTIHREGIIQTSPNLSLNSDLDLECRITNATHEDSHHAYTFHNTPSISYKDIFGKSINETFNLEQWPHIDCRIKNKTPTPCFIYSTQVYQFSRQQTNWRTKEHRQMVGQIDYKTQ